MQTNTRAKGTAPSEPLDNSPLILSFKTSPVKVFPARRKRGLPWSRTVVVLPHAPFPSEEEGEA